MRNGGKLKEISYRSGLRIDFTYNTLELIEEVCYTEFVDSDLGLYYLQTRYYDSNTGRFISPDDFSYLGANGDLLSYNLYAYCSNNPVMYVDPTGTFALLAIAGVAGFSAIVGALAIDATHEQYVSKAFWATIDFAKDVALYAWETTLEQTDQMFENAHNPMDSPSRIDSSSDEVNSEVGKSEQPVVKPKQKPTVKEGYIAPKNGAKWNKEKKGWEDKYGNVWVPAPSNSSLGHSGGHWDVQSPGGGYTNIYPGSSKTRGGKVPLPRLPLIK